MQRKNPVTSNEAYKSLTPAMLELHHGKIIAGLKKLGQATYEELALHLSMDKHQVGRRLSELERESIAYKPGVQKKTSTGRNAFVWSLTNPEWAGLSNNEFWQKWQNEPISHTLVQAELFKPL